MQFNGSFTIVTKKAKFNPDKVKFLFQGIDFGLLINLIFQYCRKYH